MLKDANHSYFTGVYIVVCGYTDLRYGIDSLAAIIENKYHMDIFVPNTLFLFVEDLQLKSKGCFGKVMVFSFSISELSLVISHGHVLPQI